MRVGYSYMQLKQFPLEKFMANWASKFERTWVVYKFHYDSDALIINKQKIYQTLPKMCISWSESYFQVLLHSSMSTELLNKLFLWYLTESIYILFILNKMKI